MLAKLRNREALKKTQESEAVYGSSSCSSPPPVHHLFPDSSTSPNLFCTLSCLYLSVAWHGSCQRHKTFPGVFTSLEFQHSFFKRMCLKFPIFSKAQIELVVDAYHNHPCTPLWSLCPLGWRVPWGFQTFSSKGWSKLVKKYSISLSQVCSEEPLVVGKILPNPETVSPKPMSCQKFFRQFCNSVQSFIFWFDIVKISSAFTLGQFGMQWEKCRE